MAVERTTWTALAANVNRSAGGLSALSRTIAGLSGWRRHAAAFLAGSLSVLAMPPLFLWPVLFFTFPVLVWLIDGSQAAPDATRSLYRSAPARAFAAGWWFGFGYFVFGLFWIGEAFLVEAEKFAWLLPFAVTLLPAGLALFTGLAAGRGAPHMASRASPASSCWRSRCRRRNGCAATSSPAFHGTCSATR